MPFLPVDTLQRDMPQMPNPKKLTHDQLIERWTNSCMRVRRVGSD
jgi:hypothetical protein